MNRLQMDPRSDERAPSDGRIAHLPVRPTVRPPRLRRLDPGDAAALCEVFSARDTLVLDGNPLTTWQFQAVRIPLASAVMLRGSHEEVALRLTEDRFCESLGERAWSDYDEDDLPVAWMLAHHFILESLGRILGEPLWPRAVTDSAQPTGPAQSVTLDFSARADDGRVMRGTLGLTPAMTSRLASHAAWRAAGDHVDRWATLPASLRIVLSAPSPFAELAGTQAGDVLVLGRRTQCWAGLQLRRLAGRSNTLLGAWSATYDGTQLTLGGAAPIAEAEVTMSTSIPEETERKTAADSLARTPVTLEFDLGSLSLPLGELAALKPGYVFQLPARLEDARVVIRAGGARIGHGELVSVGDVLGVQVLALEADGIR